MEQLALTRGQYEKLYEELNEAHDDLPGNQPELRQAARDRRDQVCEILDGFDKQDLLQNADAFKALEGKVDAANKQVRSLQEDIAKITDCVETATKIAGALDEACSAASKLFVGGLT